MSVIKKITAICIIPYVIWLIFCYKYHFIDGANLLFHEAGHFILSFMGETIQFLGGTIGQLFFPTICTVTFFRQGQKFEAAICGIWFAENIKNIAWYLADAQAQGIPLLGGGIHDWHWLLSKAGLLSSCKPITSFLHFSASLLLVGCVIILIRESFFKVNIEESAGY